MDDLPVNTSSHQNLIGLAYVVHSLNPGGTERLVVDMGLALAREFTLIVVCLDEKGLWARQLEDHGIPVYCMNRRPGLDMNIPWRLARIFHKHKIRIIHAHQCTPWFYSALSRILYTPSILLMQEHGRFFPEFKSNKRILVNKLIIAPLTYRFVAVSEDIKSRLSLYEGINHSKIEVVYNGVMAKPLMPKALIRRELGFRDDDFLVGSVGRLDRIKNIPLLLKSIGKAIKTAPNLRGVIIGDGQQYDEINKMIADMELGEIVKLVGFRNNAASLINGFDLFILPSFSEGISLALLEAMAMGIPVIATDVGGNPEVVINGQTGWMVPSNNEHVLANTILEALANPERRQQFGLAAKERFYQGFAFERMLGKYQELYATILLLDDQAFSD